jgi:hypothetical protein
MGDIKKEIGIRIRTFREAGRHDQKPKNATYNLVGACYRADQ